MSRSEWLEFGIEQGFCSRPVCITHDGWPTTFEEDEAFEDDLCVHMVRPYGDENEAKSVEQNFALAVCRKSGWVEHDVK